MKNFAICVTLIVSFVLLGAKQPLVTVILLNSSLFVIRNSMRLENDDRILRQTTHLKAKISTRDRMCASL